MNWQFVAVFPWRHLLNGLEQEAKNPRIAQRVAGQEQRKQLSSWVSFHWRNKVENQKSPKHTHFLKAVESRMELLAGLGCWWLEFRTCQVREPVITKDFSWKLRRAPYKEQDETGWLRLIKITVQPQTVSVISPHSVCLAEEGVEEKHLETL